MAQENIPTQYIEDDEITLKELILKLKEFWGELWRNWLLIGLITLPFAGYFLYDAWTTPIEYNAPITFMINDDDGGGGSGIASIAGQFGINLGGGGGEFNRDRIISLAKSEKIVLPIVTDSLEIKGKKDLIGNHLIELYSLHDKWKKGKNERLYNFYFTHNDKEKFDLVENSALKTCYRLIVGTESSPPLSTTSYDEDTGILSISTTTVAPELSLGLTQKTYDYLSDFYILQKTEPQLKSLATLQLKADSIKALIDSKEAALANLKDSNKNVVFSRFKIQEARLQREIPAYASQYGQILQNLENADFLLKNNTPFFQVIDQPFYPLSATIRSKAKALIIGIIVGVFIAVFFVIGRKIIRDSLSDS